MITYFLSSQSQEIKNYYEEYGYVVIKNAISPEHIDKFYKSYEVLKASKSYYFRSQDTNRAERLEVNTEGFLERSILNPTTELLFQKQFTQSASNIIYSNIISELLSLLSGCQKHIVWQTMFFDKSTGTVPHQDHYYLDSNPPGHLIAGWFALEDIQEEAGTFFVVPGSHKGPLIQRNFEAGNYGDHEDYVTKIKQLVAEQNYIFKPMPIEKGSVILWHPFLLHGAFENQNPVYSRKSFTAHYLPNTYGRFVDSFEGKAVNHKAPLTKATSNSNILIWEKSLSEQIKDYIRYIRYWVEVNSRKSSAKPPMEMRSSQY